MPRRSRAKLGQGAATAIAGNDILSSTLYASGIAVMYAGVYAPLIFLVIGLVLFLYRMVYVEVVEALPINGGIYNCLLNGTSKTIAALGGVVTILSYVATAVISATVAVRYLDTLVHVPVIPVTVAVLAFFAALVIAGIRDSSRVAAAIFFIHVGVLIAFIVGGCAYVALHGSVLPQNLTQTTQSIFPVHGIAQSLVFGFAASLLGVTGFETAANFVEEQAPGVFRKTLRNLVLGVLAFNPAIALVCLSVTSLGTITGSQDFVLAEVARVIGGPGFSAVIAIDAFLVLCGAVLTSYIGVSGLVFRMASDACLPHFLTKRRGHHHVYPRIIVIFFALCASILILTRGNLLSLAGLYAVAFLSVMSLFALGNLVLKTTRGALKRTYAAPLAAVIVAFCATVIGIVGNVSIDKDILAHFMVYFLPSAVLVLAMVYQDATARALLAIVGPFPFLRRKVELMVEHATKETFIVFIHHVGTLDRALRYIDRNESGTEVIIVHCGEHADERRDLMYEELHEVLPMLRRVGAYPHFHMHPVYLRMPFGPKAVSHVSQHYGVRHNRILIGSIHQRRPFDYADFGGVRIIF